MIDIHIHILPGIDDGARDWHESLAMAQTAFDDGVRHIVATPHFNHAFPNDKETVVRLCGELQNLLDERDIDLKIYPGNEVRLESPDYVYWHEMGGAFCHLDSKRRFVLMEQRWKGYDPATPEVLRYFAERSTTVILAHPERHDFFRNQPDLLLELLQIGMWTQVTADSFIGRNGPEARHFAEWLTRVNAVHTLATDAHNMVRKPNLSEGYKAVRRLAGEERVREIERRMKQILDMP